MEEHPVPLQLPPAEGVFTGTGCLRREDVGPAEMGLHREQRPLDDLELALPVHIGAVLPPPDLQQRLDRLVGPGRTGIQEIPAVDG